MSSLKKKSSIGLTFVSVGRRLSVARKCLVHSNTAGYNEWALNNIASWRSQVAVKEFFPHDVLLIDDPKLPCSCLCKYVNNGAFSSRARGDVVN